VDVERRRRFEHLIRPCKDGGEGSCLSEAAVRDRVQVREVEHRPDPAAPRGDGEDVLCGGERSHSPHDLHAERNRPVLLLQPLT